MSPTTVCVCTQTYIYSLFTGSHYDTWRTIRRLSLYSDISLQITHPVQEKLTTPLGSAPPTLFEQWCGFLISNKTEPMVFRPYPGRLEILTICRFHYKDSTFFSVIKNPKCLSGQGLNPWPPPQQIGTLQIKELTRWQMNWRWAVILCGNLSHMKVKPFAGQAKGTIFIS